MIVDESVCVILGEWICAEDGQWHFKIKKGEKIRSVSISQDLCFEELERLVIKAFRVDTSKKIIRLSFWSPDVSNVCTQTRLPPVTIESDSDVARFIRALSTCSGLNIFAGFEDIDATRCHTASVPTPSIREELLPAPPCHTQSAPPPSIREELLPIVSLSDSSFDDIEVLEHLEKVEAAYKKKAGKQPMYDQENMPNKPVYNEGRGQPSLQVDSSEDNPDRLFDELANLVSQEYRALSPKSRQLVTFTTPLEGVDPVSNSEFIGFSLGIEGLDGQTPSSPLASNATGSFDDVDENDGIPAPVDDDHPLFNDPPPFRDNLSGLDGADPIYVGRVFESKLHLQRCLSACALQQMFCYKIRSSDKRRVIAVCVDSQCQWRVYATCHKDSDNFEVRTVIHTHSCDVQSRSRYGEKASSKVLAELLQSRYANGKNGPRACDLPDLVRSELNVNISYMKAWHAKEVALSLSRGNEENSFRLLSSYLQLLKNKNPGTITDMSTEVTRDGSTHFKFLFISFGPSISGVQFLRKVVVIDGTQMKGKYKGCLVAASCQDGNMQIYPLAFGVVDSENEKSWIWFLQNLTKVVNDSQDLVFVSDRCPSIYVALSRVYPKAHHGSCIVHLFRNVKSRFKCEGLAVIVSKAARAYTIGDFRYWWTEIMNRSPPCAKYLTDIGLDHWTLSHFSGDRYNIMSSNIAESLNAAMVKAVDYPIVSMIEFIRTMLMRWFSTRRETSNNCQTRCTPVIERILVDHLEQSVKCSVHSASPWIYQVNDSAGTAFTVNLQTKTCTCKVFDVLKLPCCHAIAAKRYVDIDVYDLVDAHYSTAYWRQLYREIIMPVSQSDGDITHEGLGLEDINPPLTKRPPGRPKKVRIPSKGEGYGVFSSKSRCARCHGTGHNKATCKNPI